MSDFYRRDQEAKQRLNVGHVGHRTGAAAIHRRCPESRGGCRSSLTWWCDQAPGELLLGRFRLEGFCSKERPWIPHAQARIEDVQDF